MPVLQCAISQKADAWLMPVLLPIRCSPRFLAGCGFRLAALLGFREQRNKKPV